MTMAGGLRTGARVSLESRAVSRRTVVDDRREVGGVEQGAGHEHADDADRAGVQRAEQQIPLGDEPPTGGAPIMLSAARAKAPKVNGMARPRPLISEMFFLCVAT
jgi:hypothetical protein